MTERKAALGKSLSALGLKELLGVPLPVSEADGGVPDEQFVQISVDALQSGKYQPRKLLDDATLNELADSIRSQGVIQPIIVRPVGAKSYEIVAGERRWRAAKKAGLSQVPVIVKDIPDQAAMAMALIENIQREDLNVMEEVHAFDRLLKEFSMTHEAIAQVVGKSRATISNLVRLLKLETKVKMWLENGDLDMGHGRALLALSGEAQVQAAKRVIERGLSVRETEALVQRLQVQQEGGLPRRAASRLTAKLQALQESFAKQFNTSAKIKPNSKGGGTLTLQYKNAAELERFLS